MTTKSLFEPTDNLTGRLTRPSGEVVTPPVGAPSAYDDLPKTTKEMPMRMGVLSVIAVAAGVVLVEKLAVNYPNLEGTNPHSSNDSREYDEVRISEAPMRFQPDLGGPMLRFLYADFEGKHPDITAPYRVDVDLLVVERHPEVEAIADPAIRARIYAHFASLNLDFADIDLQAFTDPNYKPA